MCGGHSLQVDLRWPDSQNPFSIGAQLKLNTTAGTYLRDVRAASGYLSGDSVRIHFGFPDDAQLISFEIIWPDGQKSVVEPVPDHLFTITRQ